MDSEPLLAYLANLIGGDRKLLPKPSESLVDEGVIDSFGLADLVALLEKSYGVKVPDKDLALANFDTIDKIAAYVDSHR